MDALSNVSDELRKDKLDLDPPTQYADRMDIDSRLADLTYVAFDTETSGAWPIGCDIVEFGAVKWRGGQEVGRIQHLLKPREPMSDFIIGIHGITNEMVADSPAFSEVIEEVAEFFRDSVLLAHHAPFDMGFVAVEFEKAGLPLPQSRVLCTSLLARKLIHGTSNHKLQTLVSHLGIDGGAAHRALDDARSCLHVGLKCFDLLGADATLRRALDCQEKKLDWAAFSVYSSGVGPVISSVSDAVAKKGTLEFLYDKSTKPRRAKPLGLVRNPDGDFMQALCLRDRVAKRFYLEKMRDPVVLMNLD